MDHPRRARRLADVPQSDHGQWGITWTDAYRVILLGSVGIAASGCSSGPSAAAKILCGSVVASPPPDTAVAISTQTIRAAEDSGFPALVQAAKSWIKALNQHSTMASSIANRQVVTTCEHLGIPIGSIYTSTVNAPSG
jgi:hypothetical protein